MIRFCDKEICCVIENQLDRQQLLNWFFEGHRKESVCVLCESGTFIGIITYDSLLGRDMEDAIKKDYVFLDAEIWERGRRYFRNAHRQFGGEVELLPVLNKKHELLCFAYEDREANREIRMLDELLECPGALGFKDVYPEYDSVVIQGFHELSFYYYQYLERMGVPVVAEGGLWKEFGIQYCQQEQEGSLDYRTFTVYAEGTGHKEKHLELRTSVSVEFECIDHIYEENIRRGFIRDAEGDFSELISRLTGKKIYLCGTGELSINAYDLLLKEGIEIDGFISNNSKEQDRVILKKTVKSTRDIERDAVVVDVYQKHSAFGADVVDYYHYRGYKRNKKFFLLQDYTEIPTDGLNYIIDHILEKPWQRLVLVGDFLLCQKLKKSLSNSGDEWEKIYYCDLYREYKKDEKKIAEVSRGSLREGDTCLLLIAEYYGIFKKNPTKYGRRAFREELQERYITELKDYHIRDVVPYSLDNDMFYENGRYRKGAKIDIQIGKILLGTSEGFNGNIFFRGILEEHPNILVLPWGFLMDNLYSICVRLSVVGRDELLQLFWKLSELDWSCSEKEKFAFCLNGMLSDKEFHTSQELFVMIHIAFAQMQGKEIKDLSDMAIYWEPHFTPRNISENYAKWLYETAEERYIINLIRDACIRAGSFLRCNEKEKADNNLEEFKLVLGAPEIDRKEYLGWKRIVMRFEDIKRFPQEELTTFCEKIGLPWTEKMLDAKASYYGISGFDLTPVYRTYEEFFSSFDRFRLSLVTGPWQKKYGYPYVSLLDFSRRELEEMFKKKFRFEERIEFYDNEDEMIYQTRRGR